MHHQTIHGVGPNHADQARVNVYFRVTASRLVSWFGLWDIWTWDFCSRSTLCKRSRPQGGRVLVRLAAVPDVAVRYTSARFNTILGESIVETAMFMQKGALGNWLFFFNIGAFNYLYCFGGSLFWLWHNIPPNPILIIKALTLQGVANILIVSVKRSDTQGPKWLWPWAARG